MSSLLRVIFDPDATPPSVPVIGTVTALSQTALRVTWSASTDTGGSGLAGYRIFRSTSSGGTYSQIADVGIASLAYDDTTLSAGVTRFYKVLAYDGNGNASALSSAASGTTQAGTPSIFPLSISSSGRYLQDNTGAPFFLHGDTPWSIAVQLRRASPAQIDAYLDDRKAKGFSAILFNLIEHEFSDNTPRYRNREGNDPFSPMTNFASPNEAYWQVPDYIYAGCIARGIWPLINPGYLGYNGGSEGWMAEITAASAASLQSYGVFVATRYPLAGWCMGGDYAGTTTERAKQWNIVTGIRSVTPNAIITAHGARTQSAMSQWSAYTSQGLNLNNIYTDGTEFNHAATEYARTPAMPFFSIEGYYEGTPQGTLATVRRQAYASVLAGGCGHFAGFVPIWDFGSSASSGGGVANAMNQLNSTGAQQMVHVKSLFSAYAWHLLQPKTDTSLVTTSLGSGTSRIIPARASDGSFAMVWVPGAQTFTINKAALAPSSIRASWYDPTTGTYTAVSGSPFTNTGTQSLTSPGERVLVLDAQPSSGGGGGTDLVHGQTFTVTGSGFGSKAGTTQLFDDMSTGVVTDKWDVISPRTASNSTYNIQYKTPAAAGRGVALHHSRASRYLTGSHFNGGISFNGGANVYVAKQLSGIALNQGHYSYWCWYYRVDPAWVFDPPGGSNNHKMWGYGEGNEVLLDIPDCWYSEYRGVDFANTTVQPKWHVNDDSVGTKGPQGLGSALYGSQQAQNPATGWSKLEHLIGWATSGGMIRLYADNKQMLSVSGKTDQMSGSLRMEGVGGFIETNYSPNNFRYFGDIYYMRGPHIGRFVLTNHATYTSATIVEIQPYVTWSGGPVVLICNGGRLPAGTVHLHYRDEVNGHQYLGTRTMT